MIAGDSCVSLIALMMVVYIVCMSFGFALMMRRNSMEDFTVNKYTCSFDVPCKALRTDILILDLNFKSQSLVLRIPKYLCIIMVQI